jgi:hypothetical protein
VHEVLLAARGLELAKALDDSPGAKSSSSNSWRTSISQAMPSNGAGKRRVHSIASSRERTWISV